MARRSSYSRSRSSRTSSRGSSRRSSRGKSASSKRTSSSSKTRSKVFVDKKGYKRFSNSGKSVHRYVASKKLGRKLKLGEVVHHKNRNKLDNSRKNLRVLPNQKTHEAVHRKSKRLSGKW